MIGKFYFENGSFTVRIIFKKSSQISYKDIPKIHFFDSDFSKMDNFKVGSYFADRNLYLKQFEGYDIPNEEDAMSRIEKIKQRRKMLPYTEYIKSKGFDRIKDIVKERDKRCVFCNGIDMLSAHHRTYNLIQKEGEENDVYLFCEECHRILHDHRKIDGKIRKVEKR